MNAWQRALTAIGGSLQSGRVGTPCAARLLIQASDHGSLPTLAAAAATSLSRWFDSPLLQAPAAGSIESGQITWLLRFAGGQMALLSAAATGDAPNRLEAMIVGNHGVLSWEGDNPWLWEESSGSGRSQTDPADPKVAEALSEAVEAARKAPRSTSPGLRPAGATAAIRAVKPPYGVLLVGGDYTHQPNYAEALAADPRCRLIAVCDDGPIDERRQMLNRRLAERLKLPLLESLDAGLQRDDVQIVSICTEPERRGPMIVKAAAAGKHLYLDKPLTATLAEADAVAASVGDGGRLHHMFSMVHGEFGTRVRQAVQSPRLGDLLAIHFDLHFAKGHAGGARLGQPRRETPEPRSFELPESKREFTNIGVYPIVQLLWMLPLGVQRVQAVTGNYFFAEHQAADQEDYGQMLLELEGGVTASISVGRTGWTSHPGGLHQRAYLTGARGSAVIDAFRPRLEAWHDGPPWTPPERDPHDPMAMWQAPPGNPYAARPRTAWAAPSLAAGQADAVYFLDCLEQGRSSSVPATLGAAATEILLAGYRSAASGNAITLPLSRS